MSKGSMQAVRAAQSRHLVEVERANVEMKDASFHRIAIAHISMCSNQVVDYFWRQRRQQIRKHEWNQGGEKSPLKVSERERPPQRWPEQRAAARVTTCRRASAECEAHTRSSCGELHGMRCPSR